MYVNNKLSMRTTLLSVILLAGVSLTASAQFKIGGKTINTKKVVSAATDVAKLSHLVMRYSDHES